MPHAPLVLPRHAMMMEPLARLAAELSDAVAAGHGPQVVFDLDDTLFLVRPRKRAILRELAEGHSHDQEEREALQRLSRSHIPYDVVEAFSTVGIAHPERVNHLKKAFFDRFFDGRYVRHDHPNEGAVEYVRHLHAAGVRIVYLTGRPIEMHDHTAMTLATHGFPLARNASLILKDTHESHLGDAEFKGIKAGEIAANGPVFALFDNEPANLNAMHPASPEARCFLLDTDHSPNPPSLTMGAHVMGDFSAMRTSLQAAWNASPHFGAGAWTLEVRSDETA